MRRLILTAALAACPLLALAQVPTGPEFQVNTQTYPFGIGMPGAPDVALDRTGAFVVVWDFFGIDGSDYGVFSRRFDAAGVPGGPQFRVNAVTNDIQFGPRVAAHDSGRFLITWQDMRQDVMGTLKRGYSAGGAPLGPLTQVNTITQLVFEPADVAIDPSGRSTVCHIAGTGLGWALYGRRFDRAGEPVGDEYLVSDTANGNCALAAGPTGDVVATWWGRDNDVWARRYDAGGTALGSPFRVNTYTTGTQSMPDVASAGNGDFVVVWSSYGQDGSHYGVFGQRFLASGTPSGAEFRVNEYTTSGQGSARVASDASGNFVVAWAGVGAGTPTGIFARRFDAGGAPRSGDFRVSTTTAGFSWLPVAGADPYGNFVVAWRVGTSILVGTSTEEVYARRFGGLVPSALDVDTAGNHVLEPGESVDVQPSWRNVNGAAQTFAGVAASFTGPAASGVTYQVLDGSGDYGTVANGGVGHCTDCYRVAVGFGGTRPAAHWDGAMVERIAPDAQGQHARWLLHVGGSFADVPASTPEYRFVETLLHRGVTGGCTSAEYCPSLPVTRQQMAVFALAAREGAAYMPPSCGNVPRFDDVPSSSPFCRWVEELARRGVAGGCTASSFCPSAPITREQLAVVLLRALDPALEPPACSPPNFYADVPETSPYCRWIEELTRRGVVAGCGGGNFCPTAAVTRGQAAVFIAGTFGLTLYGP